MPYYDVHNADKSRPYPGIPELLEQLQEKDDIGSGFQQISIGYRETDFTLFPQHTFYRRLRTTGRGQREARPTVVHDILDITRISREDVLYVGDSGVDMQTAANAGVTACGVTWGFRPRTELEEFHPAHIVDNATEIAVIAAL